MNMGAAPPHSSKTLQQRATLSPQTHPHRRTMYLFPSKPDESCTVSVLKRTPSKVTHFVRKRRRVSIANFDIEADFNVEPATETSLEEIDADRFLTVRASETRPLNTTPRTNRIAKALGLMTDRVLNYGEATTPPAQTKVRSLIRRCASELLNNPRHVSSISAKSNLGARKQFVMALDGPGISRDPFAAPMAWSHSNFIGVAFKTNVYFQNLETRAIVHLCRVAPGDGLVHSVDWDVKTKHVLALGTTSGVVQTWDSLTQKKIASWGRDESPVGGMHWNEDALAVGRRDGRVSLFDIRTPREIQHVEGHKRQVHGVKWSADGTLLATGDHSGIIHVWDIRARDHLTLNDRKQLLKHEGPVKAISWAPWQHGLLATGGLFPDGNIQLWNINKLASPPLVIHTMTNTTSLHWSPHCKEILSTHGSSWHPFHVPRRMQPPEKLAPRTIFTNAMTVHAYPSCDKVVSINAHSAAIGHSCISPDGCSVFTVSPVEETIKMFKVWSVLEGKEADEGGLTRRCTIR